MAVEGLKMRSEKEAGVLHTDSRDICLTRLKPFPKLACKSLGHPIGSLVHKSVMPFARPGWGHFGHRN
jgi:hypothetical protein